MSESSESGNNDRESAEALWDELWELCSSEALSEEGLRELFERHGLMQNNDNAADEFDFFGEACRNERVTEGIIRCLLEYFPDAAGATIGCGSTPLHYACDNRSVTQGIIELLIDAAPGQGLKWYCQSDSLSEEGLREFIERHGLTSNNDIASISNNYGFFRAACRNERVTEGIIRCLLEYFPAAANANDGCGSTPLHVACGNKNMTRGIIELLIDAAPNTLRSINDVGAMPLHELCHNFNKGASEATLIQLLKFLIEKCPEAVRHAARGGHLPIHIALMWARSLEFCQVLIEAYHGSERLGDADGKLPLHNACRYNTFATVEYLYKLYPDAINHAANGHYPIHSAIHGLSQRSNPENAIDIVRFLLDCDPNVKLQKFEEESLLHFACFACRGYYGDSKIDAFLEVIKVIYDAYPEAIEDNSIASNIQRYHQRVQSFINSELVYARQAEDHSQMTTPDGNRQLPLHRALQNNASLGSIKLLVKGNPSALRTLDNNTALPLHIACEHHDSVSVVKYLVGLEISTLDIMGNRGNTALHYACRGAKYETITMLLEKYDAVSVSMRNGHKKLPIDLLLESNEVEDRDYESIEYTESVFRLLKAYPETVMNCNVNILTGQVKNLTLV